MAVDILLLEDSLLDADLIRHALARGELEAKVHHVADGPAYEAALKARGFDLILADFSLPGFDGSQALAMAKAQVPDIPFIFVSGVVGEEFAVESLKEGATDYVIKQRLTRLPFCVRRALDEVKERTERKRAEGQLKMLVSELRHRVKNTLASVSALNWLTLRNSSNLEDFQTAFSGRIGALSQAHELLFETNWKSADLRAVLERALAPFLAGAHGIVLQGEAARVSPKHAVGLTLVVHELATNAVKYGALSRDLGRVVISWTVTDEPIPEILLTWLEAGGPPVSPPRRSGFGTTLVARTVSDELGGVAELDYRKEGLRSRIIFRSDPVVWEAAELDVLSDVSLG
jgi:two-component sensor histidine kinase